MNIPHELIEKYNVPVPRYTSYPPANYFSSEMGEDAFRKLVIESNLREPANISLYIHIPFCPVLCLYCGCNTHITKDGDIIRAYLDALKKEIRMLSPLLDKTRKVSQVHWGGGTPNYLKIEQVEEVMQLIYDEFDFIDDSEIAMECNPALLDFHYLDRMISMGFNRISLGVQDFSEKVLREVHRMIPSIPVEEFIRHIRATGKAKVNLDFIYGLPHQTPDGFSETIERAASLQPDRLVTFSYAHVPNIKKSQVALEKAGLAGAAEKVKMYENTYRIMTSAGYTPIGLDHFARPGDELAQAAKNRSLHRNFQGYCTRETTGQVYAVGVTGISQLESGYVQNARTVSEYLRLLGEGKFTTGKGYVLTPAEKAIRYVINEVMCNHFISWEQAAVHLQTSSDELRSIIRYDERELQVFASEGLLEFTDSELHVSEKGRFFVRNVAASFDPNLLGKGKTFSKAL